MFVIVAARLCLSMMSGTRHCCRRCYYCSDSLLCMWHKTIGNRNKRLFLLQYLLLFLSFPAVVYIYSVLQYTGTTTMVATAAFVARESLCSRSRGHVTVKALNLRQTGGHFISRVFVSRQQLCLRGVDWFQASLLLQ